MSMVTEDAWCVMRMWLLEFLKVGMAVCWSLTITKGPPEQESAPCHLVPVDFKKLGLYEKETVDMLQLTPRDLQIIRWLGYCQWTAIVGAVAGAVLLVAALLTSC